MATLTIRNLNHETKAQLRLLAAKHGHSMEEEVRRILQRAVQQEERYGLGSELAQLFQDVEGGDLPLQSRSEARIPSIFADE